MQVSPALPWDMNTGGVITLAKAITQTDLINGVLKFVDQNDKSYAIVLDDGHLYLKDASLRNVYEIELSNDGKALFLTHNENGTPLLSVNRSTRSITTNPGLPVDSNRSIVIVFQRAVSSIDFTHNKVGITYVDVINGNRYEAQYRQAGLINVYINNGSDITLGTISVASGQKRQTLVSNGTQGYMIENITLSE